MIYQIPTHGTNFSYKKRTSKYLSKPQSCLFIFSSLREEEINHLTDRIQNAIKQRDEENQRLTKVADQAQRRANYMEEMLEKQNALLRQKTTKK